jgi:hypothetical protein
MASSDEPQDAIGGGGSGTAPSLDDVLLNTEAVVAPFVQPEQVDGGRVVVYSEETLQTLLGVPISAVRRCAFSPYARDQPHLHYKLLDEMLAHELCISLPPAATCGT